jgi:hypothetical protein
LVLVSPTAWVGTLQVSTKNSLLGISYQRAYQHAKIRSGTMIKTSCEGVSSNVKEEMNTNPWLVWPGRTTYCHSCLLLDFSQFIYTKRIEKGSKQNQEV